MDTTIQAKIGAARTNQSRADSLLTRVLEIPSRRYATSAAGFVQGLALTLSWSVGWAPAGGGMLAGRNREHSASAMRIPAGLELLEERGAASVQQLGLGAGCELGWSIRNGK